MERVTHVHGQALEERGEARHRLRPGQPDLAHAVLRAIDPGFAIRGRRLLTTAGIFRRLAEPDQADDLRLRPPPAVRRTLTCGTTCSMLRSMERSRYHRRSVPVRALLLEDVSAHPERYGLTHEGSEAARLQVLLELGAETARRRIDEQEMEAAYREWAEDSERSESIEELATLALGTGGLVDEVLGRGPEASPRPAE